MGVQKRKIRPRLMQGGAGWVIGLVGGTDILQGSICTDQDLRLTVS